MTPWMAIGYEIFWLRVGRINFQLSACKLKHISFLARVLLLQQQLQLLQQLLQQLLHHVLPSRLQHLPIQISNPINLAARSAERTEARSAEGAEKGSTGRRRYRERQHEALKEPRNAI